MMPSAKCEPGCDCKRHRPRAPKAAAGADAEGMAQETTEAPAAFWRADDEAASRELEGVVTNARIEDVTARARANLQHEYDFAMGTITESAISGARLIAQRERAMQPGDYLVLPELLGVDRDTWDGMSAEQRAEAVGRLGGTVGDQAFAWIDSMLESTTFLAAAGDSCARDWTLAEFGLPRGFAPLAGREALQTSHAAIIRRHWRALEDADGHPSQALLDELADAAERFLLVPKKPLVDAQTEG